MVAARKTCLTMSMNKIHVPYVYSAHVAEPCLGMKEIGKTAALPAFVYHPVALETTPPPDSHANYSYRPPFELCMGSS